LKGYNYSQAGAYFITICVQGKQCLLGKVVDGKMRLNEIGSMVEKCWLGISSHYPNVSLDVFTIMPNHMHGIIVIDSVGANNYLPLHGTSKTIGAMVRGFKIGVTKWIRQNTLIKPFWQRNYYEHIIRDARELKTIREYIQNNPLKWELDPENPYKL